MPSSMMLILGLMLAAMVSGCDWVESRSGSAPGKSTVSVTFNHDEFERDRADFRRRAQEQMTYLDAQMHDLDHRAKAAVGNAKVKLDAEVAVHQANLEQARGELKEIDAATAEKWAELLRRV